MYSMVIKNIRKKKNTDNEHNTEYENTCTLMGRCQLLRTLNITVSKWKLVLLNRRILKLNEDKITT